MSSTFIAHFSVGCVSVVSIVIITMNNTFFLVLVMVLKIKKSTQHTRQHEWEMICLISKTRQQNAVMVTRYLPNGFGRNHHGRWRSRRRYLWLMSTWGCYQYAEMRHCDHGLSSVWWSMRGAYPSDDDLWMHGHGCNVVINEEFRINKINGFNCDINTRGLSVTQAR